MKPATTDLADLYRQHLVSIDAHAAAALDAAGAERLAIFSGSERTAFRDDWHYPFKPNPHFLYWLPLTEHPYCWLLLEPGERRRLLYYQPADYWHQPPADPAGYWVEHFDIEILTDPAQARALLGDLGQTALLAENDSLGESIDGHALASWGFTSHNQPELLSLLEYQRARKTRYELVCMRRAQLLAVPCHQAAEQAFRDGGSEFDIHQSYLRASQLQDAQLPYSSIVGLNQHGAVLHYQHLERRAPTPLRSLLIDAGASYHGYAADITRTYSSEQNEFAELIEEMDRAQRQLCDQVVDGADYRQLHLSAHHAIAALLQSFDLVRMEPSSIVETGVSNVFFPHGLGHLLGLQVHDCGGFLAGPDGGSIAKPEGHPFLRLTRNLQSDFVVTIEPGLYFIEPLLEQLRQQRHSRAVNWAKVEQLAPFGGVRIEDNVAVTIEQPENLTRAAYAMSSDAA